MGCLGAVPKYHRSNSPKVHSNASLRRSRAVDQYHRETEYGRLLPATLQVHIARIPLLSSGAETTPRAGDADVDYQSCLLGGANIEVISLAQTAAGLSSEDF